MTPTNQQVYCLKQAEEQPMLKIEACAGGGKTSTLEYISNNLLLKSIYIAFNKQTATEASNRFPSHVTCQTTHSLAFRIFGAPLMSKLSRPKGRYVNVAGTGSEIAKKYGLDGVGVAATANAMGLYVKTTVERFEQSADMNMGLWHVPKKDMEKVLAEDPTAAAYVLKWAQRLWSDRCTLSSDVLATHDTYLKLYQMSKPILPYDVVYADEFQDTSPCVMDIVLNQKHAKIIMVGDRRQAIYGWRGAVNAMQMVKCAEAPLSMSFRYGPGIAEVATAVLGKDMIVEGRADLPSVIGFNVVDRTKPHMYLFRTNAALLLEAVTAVDKGQKVNIEIDVRDFVKLLQSAQALYDGKLRDVKHEKILPYTTWYDMVEESEETGGELKRVVGIVASHQAEHIINVLENYTVPRDAIATYTTAHKAKGRECQQVILADDFPSHFKQGRWVGLAEHEENLLYVAVTRSQWILEINSTVEEVLEKYEIAYERGQWEKHNN